MLSGNGDHWRTGLSSGSFARSGAGGLNPAETDLLNINEVAAALRVSKMTVYRFIHDGRLRALRLGSSFRIHRSDLDAYLDAAFLPPLGSEPEASDGTQVPPAI